MTGLVLSIRTDGTYRLIEHDEGEPVGLEMLQSLVEGFIQRVVTREFEAWVDEDGLLKPGIEANPAASALLAIEGRPGYALVGPVVLTAASDDEIYPLPPAVAERLVGKLQSFGCQPADEEAASS